MFWRGLRLLNWKLVWNFWGSRESVFDRYEDSCEQLLDILKVVIISSPISSACGMEFVTHLYFVTQNRVSLRSCVYTWSSWLICSSWIGVHDSDDHFLCVRVRVWDAFECGVRDSFIVCDFFIVCDLEFVTRIRGLMTFCVCMSAYGTHSICSMGWLRFVGSLKL